MDNYDKKITKNYLNEAVIKRLECHLEKINKVIANCEELISIAKQLTKDEEHLLDGLYKTTMRLENEIKDSGFGQT